ncbi:hypothetical protein BDP27DRAFT_1425931 [Rhodocollybia butyracea]|uniref:Uncharacterized protein n=1 Tax=Rhodocollybia butyracea TaxID=206335 RepID=A0A9P5PJH2_9AGAR|nr:hypothetical protein BDP27DRAFT_1425931 [Rhodocollybia butyracea]
MQETTGDDERRSRWKHKVHKVYRKQIRDKVGNPIPPIESRKALKVPSPEVYDGSPDVNVFERWLMSLLQWMVVNRMCGDNYDATRTAVLGMFLKGKALDWYNDEVAGIHRTVLKWTFEGAIIGVFDCCIQAMTIHQAARQFDLIESVKPSNLQTSSFQASMFQHELRLLLVLLPMMLLVSFSSDNGTVWPAQPVLCLQVSFNTALDFCEKTSMLQERCYGHNTVCNISFAKPATADLICLILALHVPVLDIHLCNFLSHEPSDPGLPQRSLISIGSSDISDQLLPSTAPFLPALYPDKAWYHNLFSKPHVTNGKTCLDEPEMLDIDT